jgi:cysteinyl-tRNA synthetase
MSKSLGNFYTLRDPLALGYDARAIRYLLVSQHYRKPINFTLDGISWAGANLNRLGDCVRRLEHPSGSVENERLAEFTRQSIDAFYESMDDDLNSAAAMGFVFELGRELNSAADRSELPAKNAGELQRFFGEVSAIFGLALGTELTLDQELEGLVARREELRKSRKFAEADAIRDELLRRGILLEDTPSGVRWKKKV